ncbi:MAG: class I tRNA ligase family protein [Candidatus Peribacteraceae bacterium]|nr:class I tRNA ligase family protein [Candidatus Peribacteraceae bacterium]
MFDSVDPKQRLPELEEGILRYWQEEDIFKRSLRLRSEGTGDLLDGPVGGKQETFSFYDGPPFATGLPHYGHLLAGTIKDVIPRYQTMCGKYVERRFGWDCHGLPVENLIEKEHNITSHKQIEDMGIGQFNELCCSSVQRYTKEWRNVVERMGRFVDMDHDYRTMDPEYMESIWWVFSQLHEKGLIYEGRKAMQICPRCETPLSNFEVTQGYKDIDDTAVIWKFKLEGEQNTFVLAWTTTPWSTLSTMGLSIRPDAAYVRVRTGDETLIMAKGRVSDIMKGTEHYEIGEEFAGKKLVGKAYEHIADWYGEIPEVQKNSRAYHIFAGDYVDPLEGTGIVTINGSYGEIDMEAAKKNKLPIIMDVQMNGHFGPEAGPYAGMHVEDGEKKLIGDFQKKGLVWRKETYRHSYPHCWRCETPLLNYATSSWFVNVTKIKEDLLAANAETEWVPAHVRDGRFGKWLTGARDWAISRNRYWGTPLPIWRCEETKDLTVIQSRDELMAQQKLRFTKVTVLRHGESEGNLVPVYQGKCPGTHLTEQGRKQAAAAADYLKSGEIAAIYCSPLDRTKETAAVIAKVTGAPVIVDERLHEVIFGDYEGKTVDFSDLTFVKARRAHKLETNAPESIYHFPGMETFAAVHERISAFLEEVLPLHRGGHIVLVTHADPLQNIKHFFTGEDPMKLNHRPYPRYAEPISFFWDHHTASQLDLHKHVVDDVTWGASSAKEKSVHLTCVRHGETDWNKQRKLQGGNGDIPLNENGRQQANDLAKKLKRKKFDAIVSSDLSRTAETAKILSAELGVPVAASWEILRERHQGDWSGRSTDEIRQEFSMPQGVSISFHPGSPPNGETRSAFLSRVDHALNELLRTFAGKRILLIGHGGVFRAMQSIIEHIPPEEAKKLSQNAGTYEMTYRSSPDVHLTLVRHGETDYNREGKVNGGNVDTLLNETGRAQVRALAKKLKKKKYDVIISSDLKRAVETAEILSAELNVPYSARWKELRERDTGAWTGKPGENYVTTLATGEILSPGLSTLTPPGGESFESFLNRLEAALTRIRAEYPGKRVLVACHGGPIKCLQALVDNLSLAEAAADEPQNATAIELTLSPLMRRIPEVLDCWFESGSMPYAQNHFPFAYRNHKKKFPIGFPADFIAEGMDQTRGWFYTLMILSTALYKKPAFLNCIVNGIVLAEDGKKMSKRLKNYPEPTEVVHRHGADAVRFTLMSSPAVKGEDLRFSEKLVEETVRSVLLPLWNVYSFFVTYANAAHFEPVSSRRHSSHPLDRYIRAEVQDLVNRITRELNRYDLSAACAEIHERIDALTNWYVRLSRRRFAGKGAVDEEDASPSAELSTHEDEQIEALATLEDVLLTLCQVLAPFCPFITDAIYLNLVPEDHGSVHLTDWPGCKELTNEERSLIERNRLLRLIVSLGHGIRAGKKIKVRQPLQRAVVALPPALARVALTAEDRQLLMSELNVKDIEFTDDPGSLATRIAQVDARKAGPRLGARVQEIIRAGKAGDFTVREDGAVLILDEVLSPEEAVITYRGREGEDIAVEKGVVVSMDTTVTDALRREGTARDLIRAVQKIRKEAGLHFLDSIALQIDGLPDVLQEFSDVITQETHAVLQKNDGPAVTVDVSGSDVTIRIKLSHG